MGGRKKAKASAEPPEAEDFMGGLSLFEAGGDDWISPGASIGWGPNSVHEVEDEDEDDEDEDDEDEDEEEEEEPVPRKGRRQQQQQQNHYQNPKQSGKGQQNQKDHQGKNHQGPKNGQRNNNPQRSQQKPQKQPQNQKSQKNQKGKQGPKAQKQQQEPSEEAPNWGVTEGGYGGWNPGGSNVSSGGGGGNDWAAPKNQSFVNQHQQHRLASLLEDIPEEHGRTRGSNQQGPKRQGRAATPVEHASAAASGKAPSRTLFYAVSSSAASVLDGGASDGPHATIQLRDSGGIALHDAQRALYSRQRPASQRIHWLFNPRKDPRVASLLDWIQAMSYGLATLGLHKFLETRQRGALVANADYRSPRNASEPAFDWLTFKQVVPTHDKILQESMAFYEPDNQVLVFVFLLSRTGNSLAMWRRKLPVPTAVRNKNRGEITRVINSLAMHKYVVTVDELPPPPPPPSQPKPKKKWFRW